MTHLSQIMYMIVCYSVERFSVGTIALMVGGRNQRSDIELNPGLNSCLEP